jgi:serine/threonine protein kinase
LYFLIYTAGFVHHELANDLLKECHKMSEFDHPNVLKLVGVCLDGGPAPYIVMPFMENGSLLSYLRKERDVLVSKPDVQDAVS